MSGYNTYFRSQSRFLSALLAVVMLVSQASFVYASLDKLDFILLGSGSSTSSMHNCHQDMDVSRGHSTTDSCCETQECMEQCQIRVHTVSGAMIPAPALMQDSYLSTTLVTIADQFPSGLTASSLYRPPRQF